MPNEANNVLREFVTQIVQQPVWDQSGKKTQMVTAYFTTPHGFTGQVEMPHSDWTNESIRNQKLFQAIADLEGPFWEPPETPEEEG